MIRQTFFITFVKFRASLKCILLIVVERIKLWNRKTTLDQYYVDLMSTGTAYWVHQTCLGTPEWTGGGGHSDPHALYFLIVIQLAITYVWKALRPD